MLGIDFAECELKATQFAFVSPCPPHLHEQVVVLYGSSYITNCST